MTTKVVEIELAQPLPPAIDLGGYDRLLALIRLNGVPIGQMNLGHLRSQATAEQLKDEIGGRFGWQIWQHLLQSQFAPPPAPACPPSDFTIIVCTRNRADQLKSCLDSLLPLHALGATVIIVDNAPSDSSTETLVHSYPFSYIREDRPGLDNARNRGLQEAKTPLVAYTDDDVVVDSGWLTALAGCFDDPLVVCATGLVMPLELETVWQELFETYTGFGRGFARRVFDYTTIEPLAAGNAGAGANMAFRRSTLLELGGFDPGLDAGTYTESGGDSYAYYRVLANGYRIVYEPSALVWHRHRRDKRALHRAIYGYGVGVYAYFAKCLVEDHEIKVLKAGWRYFVGHHLRELVKAILRRRTAVPLWLVLAEIKGVFVGPYAYFRARPARRADSLSAGAQLGEGDMLIPEARLESPALKHPISAPQAER